MLRRKYNIRYELDNNDKEILLIIDGNNYQLEFDGDTFNFKPDELTELCSYLDTNGFNARMQEDILKIINENISHQIREDINYLLIDLEQSLEGTDQQLMTKFLELKNKLLEFETNTAIDIDTYEKFKDDFNLN